MVKLACLLGPLVSIGRSMSPHRTIRSRTKEALRARVRAGRIAGGRCFGYALKRETDSTGRAYTVAVIDENEASVVRRIFGWYIERLGLKKIARWEARDELLVAGMRSRDPSSRALPRRLPTRPDSSRATGSAVSDHHFPVAATFAADVT